MNHIVKSVANAFLLFAFVVASTAKAAPTYEIIPLGFTDAEHTRDNGSLRSVVNEINESGQVIGVSYLGTPYYGTSAWVYDGTNTIRLGFFGTEHTRPHDDNKESYPEQLNEEGKVVGISRRFLSSNANGGYSAWLYDGTSTIQLGFTDTRHTRTDGYKNSRVEYLNEAGQALGYSDVYASSTFLGQNSWLYDGTSTIQLGFTNSEHTRSGGFRFSNALRLNEAGQVTGYSSRYNGGSVRLGQSAWFYDGLTTINIGLAGPEYTRNDGYKDSSPYQMNDAGQVSGNSTRYNGSNTLGASNWLYDGTATIEIGLRGQEHTSSSGYRSSSSIELNQAGQVRGIASRYNGGSANLGESAWLYNGTTTIDIGLTGPEFTRDDGYKRSESDEMNEAGQVRGSSWRFNLGSEQLGQSAWLYDGAATIELGFTGPEHTSITGTKESVAVDMNEAGQVYGYSVRYNHFDVEDPNDEWGSSAWLYNGVSTIDIGLLGPEYTRIDNYKYNEATQLNEAGQVIGRAGRFIEGSQEGQSAWLYDGVTTIDIGLTGPEYTQTDGSKFSEANQLNQAGQVVGYSKRYSEGGGKVAWFHDPTLGQSIPLQLSPDDGDASSFVEYLGEDGLVLGYYTQLDSSGETFVDRAFSFTMADGMRDLGSLVDGGLPANGWDYLADAIRTNGRGQIIGQGKITGQPYDIMSYLLTPIFTPGDFDEDGDVDGRDFLVWQRGGSPTPLSADDLADWQANYGVPTISALENLSVPEPSAFVLASICSLFLVRCRVT